MEQSSSFNTSQTGTGDNKTKKYLLWGCLAAIICACVALLAGGIAFVVKFGGEPEGLSANYSMPSLVEKGEVFELVISMTNTGTTDIEVSDIDLDEVFDDSILDGLIVLESDPHMEKDYSISGIKTFKYNRTINPGDTHTVIFTLQAVTSGEFGGPIGHYVGDLAKRFDYVGIVITE